MEERRIQFTIKNEELLGVLMSLPKVQRGQFIAMSLAAYVKTEEGQHMLSMFGKQRCDKISDVNQSEPAKREVSFFGNTVMGEFE